MSVVSTGQRHHGHLALLVMALWTKPQVSMDILIVVTAACHHHHRSNNDIIGPEPISVAIRKQHAAEQKRVAAAAVAAKKQATNAAAKKVTASTSATASNPKDGPNARPPTPSPNSTLNNASNGSADNGGHRRQMSNDTLNMGAAAGNGKPPLFQTFLGVYGGTLGGGAGVSTNTAMTQPSAASTSSSIAPSSTSISTSSTATSSSLSSSGLPPRVPIRDHRDSKTSSAMAAIASEGIYFASTSSMSSSMMSTMGIGLTSFIPPSASSAGGATSATGAGARTIGSAPFMPLVRPVSVGAPSPLSLSQPSLNMYTSRNDALAASQSGLTLPKSKKGNSTKGGAAKTVTINGNVSTVSISPSNAPSNASKTSSSSPSLSSSTITMSAAELAAARKEQERRESEKRREKNRDPERYWSDGEDDDEDAELSDTASIDSNASDASVNSVGERRSLGGMAILAARPSLVSSLDHHSGPNGSNGMNGYNSGRESPLPGSSNSILVEESSLPHPFAGMLHRTSRSSLSPAQSPSRPSSSVSVSSPMAAWIRSPPMNNNNNDTSSSSGGVPHPLTMSLRSPLRHVSSGPHLSMLSPSSTASSPAVSPMAASSLMSSSSSLAPPPATAGLAAVLTETRAPLPHQAPSSPHITASAGFDDSWARPPSGLLTRPLLSIGSNSGGGSSGNNASALSSSSTTSSMTTSGIVGVSRANHAPSVSAAQLALERIRAQASSLPIVASSSLSASSLMSRPSNGAPSFLSSTPSLRSYDDYDHNHDHDGEHDHDDRFSNGHKDNNEHDHEHDNDNGNGNGNGVDDDIDNDDVDHHRGAVPQTSTTSRLSSFQTPSASSSSILRAR
jgi:hypothetical protein